MKIKLLKNSVCGSKTHKAGSVIEASDSEARFLIALKKAEACSTKKAAAKKSPVNKAISTEDLKVR